MLLNSMGYIYEWTNGRLGTERKVKVQVTAPAQVTTETTVQPAETKK